jgi:hypothetical protein
VPGGYVIRNANGQALAYIYSRDNAAEALQAKVLTKDEARRIAINVARLPELIGKAESDCAGQTGLKANSNPVVPPSRSFVGTTPHPLWFARCAQSAHGGQQQEATMSLLFWYLPLMIMSGAFDTLYRSDEAQVAEVETCKLPLRAEETQCRSDF